MILFKIIGVIISSILLWASFPPYAQSDSAWLALAPLLLMIRLTPPKEAFKWVFLAGLGYWVLTLSWFPAIIKNGGPWFLVILGQFALAAWCALFMGVFAFVSGSLWQMAGSRPALRRVGLIVLVDPLLWVGTEYIRGWLLSGFAWNFLGVSQVRNTALIQVASVAGVYGVSAVLVMVNGGVTSIVERAAAPFALKLPREQRLTYPNTIAARILKSSESFVPILCAILGWCWGMNRVKNQGEAERDYPAWRVALVQPNTPCVFVFNDQTMRQQLKILLDQTRLASAAKPHLVVWPETALLGSVPDEAGAMKFARKGAALSGSALLTGTLETERVEKSSADPYGLRFYNAAWMFASNGCARGSYRKQHLVPFGEYIPLDKIIPVLQKLAPTGVSCTPGEGPSLIELPGDDGGSVKIGSLICFEDTIPALSRQAVRAGAGMLVLMTNDAWFNGSIEPVQHLHQSVFRAVECGVPLARSANSGVSCAVDAVGNMSQLTSENRATDFSGFLMTQVRIPEKAPHTPYVALGDWVLAIPGMCALLLTGGFLLVKRQRGE